MSDTLVPIETDNNPLAKLTDRQKAFVHYYCTVSRFNGTDAARRAGYSDPCQSAWLNKTNVDIQEAIEKYVDPEILTEKENLKLLSAYGKSSLRPFLQGNKVDLETPEADEYLDMLNAVETKETTRFNPKTGISTTTRQTKVKLEDRIKAKELIGKYHGSWKADVNNNTQVNILYNLPEDNLETMVTEARTQHAYTVPTDAIVLDVPSETPTQQDETVQPMPDRELFNDF